VIVAVASRNPNKLRAVERAYRAFGVRAEVVPVDRPPGLPRQPVGTDVIIKCAESRAREALKAARAAEHGVGIEAGVACIGGYCIDVTVAAIADVSGRVTLGMGPAFQVPDALLGDVMRGVELGAIAERFYRRGAIGRREGLVGVLTRRRVTRLDLNTAAVIMALAPRLPFNAGLYAPGP
jgi:inosine/xanthosine triphosphatase